MMKSFAGAAMLIPLAGIWIAAPIVSHNEGTARNVTTTLLVEPFVDGPQMTYTWDGDIYRSCPIEIRRTIVDSAGVVTRLVPQVFGRLLAEDLGRQSYEVSVSVPLQIAEGPAVYYAVEIPACDWLQRLLPSGVPYPPVEFTVTRP